MEFGSAAYDGVLVEAVSDLLLPGFAGLVAPGGVEASAEHGREGSGRLRGVDGVVGRDLGDLQRGLDVLAGCVVGAIPQTLLGRALLLLGADVPRPLAGGVDRDGAAGAGCDGGCDQAVEGVLDQSAPGDPLSGGEVRRGAVAVVETRADLGDHVGEVVVPQTFVAVFGPDLLA